MTITTAIIEVRQPTATGLEALLCSPTWETFDEWMNDALARLEATWQSASSPKARQESDRQSRRK